MAVARPYEPLLYRGTSSGWPGNAVLQSLRITPTTSDPSVAVLFAVECQRFGHGILLVCQQNEVSKLIGQPNVLAEVESEVVIDDSPVEFAERFARWTIDADVARRTLTDLGFEVPPVIGDKRTLAELLKSSRRLSPQEILEFDRRLIWEAAS